jgi:MoxR-like ATPase
MTEQSKQNVTPFIPEDKRKIVLTALETYLQELEQHKLNAEHLLEKVNRYALSK